MKFDFSPLTLEEFLSDYWQQKPYVFRGGLPNFTESLSPDELAGLATEQHIESRLIFQREGQWHLENGPFFDYSDYGETHWSLVVQSVNHWHRPTQDLALTFDFIPAWRFDDVMVSFAAPHGGVGPHVDNYDVFICQGSGSRHWRVGASRPDSHSLKEIIHQKTLRHVEAFDAIIDETLHTGDVLYIPPGFPHEGIAKTASMSFSIGYQSTNAHHLLSAWADYHLDWQTNAPLLSDAKRTRTPYGEISSADCNHIRQLLQQLTTSDASFYDFIGRHYSSPQHELDLCEQDWDYALWQTHFQTQPLYKTLGLKTLYTPISLEKTTCYQHGEPVQLPWASAAEIAMICNQSQLTYEQIQQFKQPNHWLQWLHQSTNTGYWFFDDDIAET